MAELILTEQEQADSSFLDWSDESLGKLVKKTALMMKDEYGAEAAYITMASHLLISLAEKCNSTETTLEVNGVTQAGEARGDWKVTIERTDK